MIARLLLSFGFRERLYQKLVDIFLSETERDAGHDFSCPELNPDFRNFDLRSRHCAREYEKR